MKLLSRRHDNLFHHCLEMLKRAFISPSTKKRRPYIFPFAQQLEARLLLSGNPVANNDAFSIPYYSTGQINAPGVLANDTDPNQSQLMAHLVSGPSHASFFQLNSDGSFNYSFQSGFLGPDSFTYYDTNSMYAMSNTATVSLSVQYSVASSTDLTKQVAIDPLDTGLQILGSSSAAPATAHNLALAYDSVAAQPDAVIEGMFQFNAAPIPDTPTGSLTFNGVAQPATYVNLQGVNGASHNFDLSYQVDTSALPTGRYPYTLTLNSPNMSAPATLTGAVNVVNDSAGPVGKGWDIPGLYQLVQNNVPGVPAGVLLTTGDGHGWYFTQAAGGSYTSPNGPFAFDTLTSVTGGGWQLVDKFGTTFNFNSAGGLTSRVERTGETTTYNSSGGLVTSIIDEFGRAVNLGYTSGQLSSITDFAGHVWSLAHVGANLTSVTEPDPGGGSPVWQYAYSGNYLSAVTDPDNNQNGYVLDAHHRLSQANLAGGGSTSATSEQSLAYGGATQSGAPNATPSASVETTSTDAMNNTSATQTDAFGDPLYYQDVYGNITTWQRDQNGLVSRLTEPPPTPGAAAPVTNYSHDTMGNETSATGAHPTYGTYVFNTFGEWTSFTDSQNHVWGRAFDTRGNLQSTIDPLQNTVSYTNDALGYPLTMTQPAPNNAAGTVTTTYTRDAYERMTKTTWPDATFRTFAYDTLDHQMAVTDENNHTTTTTLDALSRVVNVANALNGNVATTYDKDSNVLTTRDEMGNLTSNVWNTRNELVQQTLPDPDGAGPLTSPIWSWTYDADARKLTETDPMNRVSSWAWDKLSRMVQEILPDPDGAGPLSSPVIVVGYDNLSRKTSEQNPLNGTTAWAYAKTDTSQMTSMTLPDPDGSGSLTSPVWTYSYDTLGRRDQTDDPMGHLQTTSFDADGRTAGVLDNLGHGPTYAYGHGGEMLTTTDANSNATSNQYDSRYRLVQTTAADGGTTQITLDPAGNRVALVDPANNRTTWVLDALNRPTTETTALGTTTTAYDPSSDVTSVQDADGRVRDFGFDNLHRLTTENWMSGNTIVRTIATGYDADNEVTSMSDPDSDYAFGLNNLGQTLTVDNAGTPNVPHVILANGYDAGGDRTSLSATINGTADFLNSYSFDADQRLTVVEQQAQSGGNAVAPKQFDLNYNALGQFTSAWDYNYVGAGPAMDVASGVYSYDTGNRLTGLS
jgi:YD repeat-containing protein